MKICENVVLTDVVAQGVERIEIFGGYARIVYWHWRYRGGIWERAIVDVAIVLPMSSFIRPPEEWCPCVIRVPGPEIPGVIGPPLN